MTIHIVKCIICAIALGVLCGVIGYRNHRKPAVNSKKQSDTQYVVGVPSALKYVYMAMFLLGIGLFLIFLVFKVSGNESVTMGHLYFSLVFAGIGLFVGRKLITIDGLSENYDRFARSLQLNGKIK